MILSEKEIEQVYDNAMKSGEERIAAICREALLARAMREQMVRLDDFHHRYNRAVHDHTVADYDRETGFVEAAAG